MYLFTYLLTYLLQVSCIDDFSNCFWESVSTCDIFFFMPRCNSELSIT